MCGDKGISFTFEAIIAGFIILSSLLLFFKAPNLADTSALDVSEKGYECLKSLDENNKLREYAMNNDIASIENELKDCLRGINYSVQICRSSCVPSSSFLKTLRLQNGTDNLGDAYVRNDTPDTNYNNEYLHVRSTNPTYRIYIRFNISSIPEHVKIISSMLHLFDSTAQTGSPEWYADIHHIYSNSPWNESTITWNNQICGNILNQLNESYCNNTPISHRGYQRHMRWVVTDAVEREYRQGNKNVSFVIMSNDEGGNLGKALYFKSKENSDASRRPMLEINYSYVTNKTIVVSEYFISGDEEADPLYIKLSMCLP